MTLKLLRPPLQPCSHILKNWYWGLFPFIRFNSWHYLYRNKTLFQRILAFSLRPVCCHRYMLNIIYAAIQWKQFAFYLVQHADSSISLSWQRVRLLLVSNVIVCHCVALQGLPPLGHTHIHTHAHAHTRAHTHTHTHTCTNPCIHTDTSACLIKFLLHS